MKRFPPFLFSNLFCWLTLLGGAVLIAATGPVPQLIYPSDVASYLDATYRAALGQTLGTDYLSPIGPAALLPTVVAMRFGAMTVHALSIGASFVWLIYGAGAWLIARHRMHGGLAWSFMVFSAGVAAAPYTLDFGSWRILSYGMVYNRLAWAALGILAVFALLKPQKVPAPSALTTAALLGAGAGWLWAIKPNYLLILAPLILIAWLNAQDRRVFWWTGAGLSGAALTLLLVGCGVHFDLLGYAAEHLAMAKGAPGGLMLYTLRRSLAENLLPFAALATSGLLLLGLPFSRSHLAIKNPAFWRVLIAMTLVPATLIANVTNCQFSEIPFWGALGWIIAAQAQMEPLRNTASRIAWGIAVVVGICYTWQPIASLPYAGLWRYRRGASDGGSLRVASARWEAMRMRLLPGEKLTETLDLGANPSAGAYAAWLNDGLALLQRQPSDHPVILCLDWTNPFPFATATRPVLHDQIAWHVGRTIDQHHHPEVDRLCDSADVIMEPKTSLQPASLQFKRELFRPSLDHAFVLVDESVAWRIWKKQRVAGSLEH